MKIVDEKGKLFGLINIVDLLVVILIIAIVGVVAVKILGDKATNVIATKVDCYIEVTMDGLYPEIVDEAMRQGLPGQRLVSGNEYVSGAVIVDIWEKEFIARIETEDGFISAVDPTKKGMTVLIKTQVPPDTAAPTIGSQDLKAGKAYIVKTQTFEREGIITRVEIGTYTGKGKID